jgi:hypothetical protein
VGQVALPARPRGRPACQAVRAQVQRGEFESPRPLHATVLELARRPASDVGRPELTHRVRAGGQRRDVGASDVLRTASE